MTDANTPPYQDISTNYQWQFIFHCEKCDQAFPSTPELVKMAAKKKVVDFGTGLLKNIFFSSTRAKQVIDQVSGSEDYLAQREAERREALKRAIEAVKSVLTFDQSRQKWLCQNCLQPQ